ncbi:hypothetical protein L1987_83659 [Smallanthus sonchifolius]|uniref:Uncharacterized protein n=1 Tax=Smallanthus sonchifolius TaxID=185202 RepID=A0ACB8YD35_9ASTR|nr:hypothetical protein L1987_83659 [Smallanthus sonchifolius]
MAQVVTLPDDAYFDVVQWYDKSVWGKTIDVTQLCCLRKSLDRGGLKDVKIRYLGGLHVLITFKNYTEAIALVEGRYNWAHVFSNLEVWMGQEYSYERIVWIKIFGVPVHLWEAHVFDKIATLIGTVVAPSHAKFDYGSIVNDTVGIMVGKDWSSPEPLTLKWRTPNPKVAR